MNDTVAAAGQAGDRSSLASRYPNERRASRRVTENGTAWEELQPLWSRISGFLSSILAGGIGPGYAESLLVGRFSPTRPSTSSRLKTAQGG